MGLPMTKFGNPALTAADVVKSRSMSEEVHCSSSSIPASTVSNTIGSCPLSEGNCVPSLDGGPHHATSSPTAAYSRDVKATVAPATALRQTHQDVEVGFNRKLFDLQKEMKAQAWAAEEKYAKIVVLIQLITANEAVPTSNRSEASTRLQEDPYVVLHRLVEGLMRRQKQMVQAHVKEHEELEKRVREGHQQQLQAEEQAKKAVYNCILEFEASKTWQSKCEYEKMQADGLQAEVKELDRKFRTCHDDERNLSRDLDRSRAEQQKMQKRQEKLEAELVGLRELEKAMTGLTALNSKLQSDMKQQKKSFAHSCELSEKRMRQLEQEKADVKLQLAGSQEKVEKAEARLCEREEAWKRTKAELEAAEFRLGVVEGQRRGQRIAFLALGRVLGITAPGASAAPVAPVAPAALPVTPARHVSPARPSLPNSSNRHRANMMEGVSPARAAGQDATDWARSIPTGSSMRSLPTFTSRGRKRGRSCFPEEDSDADDDNVAKKRRGDPPRHRVRTHSPSVAAVAAAVAAIGIGSAGKNSSRSEREAKVAAAPPTPSPVSHRDRDQPGWNPSWLITARPVSIAYPADTYPDYRGIIVHSGRNGQMVMTKCSSNDLPREVQQYVRYQFENWYLGCGHSNTWIADSNNAGHCIGHGQKLGNSARLVADLFGNDVACKSCTNSTRPCMVVRNGSVFLLPMACHLRSNFSSRDWQFWFLDSTLRWAKDNFQAATPQRLATAV